MSADVVYTETTRRTALNRASGMPFEWGVRAAIRRCAFPGDVKEHERRRRAA